MRVRCSAGNDREEVTFDLRGVSSSDKEHKLQYYFNSSGLNGKEISLIQPEKWNDEYLKELYKDTVYTGSHGYAQIRVAKGYEGWSGYIELNYWNPWRDPLSLVVGPSESLDLDKSGKRFHLPYSARIHSPQAWAVFNYFSPDGLLSSFWLGVNCNTPKCEVMVQCGTAADSNICQQLGDFGYGAQMKFPGPNYVNVHSNGSKEEGAYLEMQGHP